MFNRNRNRSEAQILGDRIQAALIALALFSGTLGGLGCLLRLLGQ